MLFRSGADDILTGASTGTDEGPFDGTCVGLIVGVLVGVIVGSLLPPKTNVQIIKNKLRSLENNAIFDALLRQMNKQSKQYGMKNAFSVLFTNEIGLFSQQRLSMTSLSTDASQMLSATPTPP